MLFACFMFSVMCSSATGNGLSGSSPDTVRLAFFGVKANSFENAASGIVKAIGFCKSKKNVILSLPGGRIDIWPEGAFKKELYISN